MRIHNTYVHTRLKDRMVQEHGMNRFANLSHTTETKRQVANSARNLHIWTLLLNTLRCVDEVNSIVVVLFHSSADCQHIRIENDIFRREFHLVHKNVVTTLADAQLLRCRGSLTIFVESHHHNSGTVLLQQSGLLHEQLLANLQRNRVDDALSLAPLQSSKDNIELRRVKHKRNLRYLWLRHSNLDKLLHGSKTIQHTVIDVDVQDVRTIFDLLLRNVHGRAVVTFHHELLESNRSTDVTAFANVQEWQTKVVVHIVNHQVLKTRQPHLWTANIRQLTSLKLRRHLTDGLDVLRR
mmetsp:Transcript_11469/g.19061  ORF Transcript_11469/g.19061 Transcript_11469/m.19061 type:complete len:295 (+) Transcript_11469:2100-2984(+)